MLNYTSSGGIFTIIGKLCGRVNSYLTFGGTTLPNDLDTLIAAISAGGWGDMLTPLNGYYSSPQSQIASLRQNLANLANTRLLESDVVSGLGVTQSNITTVLAALLKQMVTDTQTVAKNTVTVGTITPGGSNVGTGTIFISPILDGATNPASFAKTQPVYNGLTSELCIPETMAVTCTVDSFSGNATAGQETFQITGPLGQSSVWGLGTEGTGSGPSFQTVQASTLITNAGFTNFAGNVPASWTLVTGTAGTNCNQDTTAGNYILSGSSVKLTGDSVTPTIQLTQALNKAALTPMKRYLFAIWYKASAAATGAQALQINFTGTGYTPASSEQITIPGNSWQTAWTLVSFYVNLPQQLPANWTISISLTGTVPSGTNVWLDAGGFSPLTYENGLGFAASTGNTAFVRGDNFSSVIANDFGGTFQVFARRQFGCQLPSSSSPTIPNSLAT